MKSSSIRSWRLKGKLKFFIILLFCFSFLFITYQVLYYKSLNLYQNQEDLEQAERYQRIKQDQVDKLKNNEFSKPLQLVDQQREEEIVQFGKVLTTKVIGVSPEHQTFYDRRNKKHFTCLSSGRIVNWDKVNDDFCDCPNDGSDEPSTAACMNGHFYCSKIKTKGYKDYIPSSFVNDGICDCCTVTGCEDEFDLSVISLKNRC